MILKGTFTSVWDDGVEITTNATLNTETGEVVTESVDVEELEILDREFFTDNDNNEYEICPDCHCSIVKTTMEADNVGNGLHEEKKCMGGCND